MINRFRILLVMMLVVFSVTAQDKASKSYRVHTIAFYNVENLFDTINDPHTNDEEWLSTGSQHWTGAKYKKKLANLAKVISQLGTGENNPNSPVILGVAEVENRQVLEDLIKQPGLAEKGYAIIHFDSPDKRGIDNGLLYQTKYFKPTSYKNIPLYIYENGKAPEKKDDTADDAEDKSTAGYDGRIFTRDQLLVTGLLDGEEVSFIVNHWPSRSGGEKKSSPNREAAAALNKKTIDSLYAINPNLKLITMGDLNDGPYNNSVKKVLDAKAHKDEVKEKGLFNPMAEMSDKGIGTLAYRDAWDLFDQMILTEPLIKKDFSSFRFWKAGVWNKTFMTQPSGQYRGYPLRNANGEVGYSDHFPVYLYLVKEQK
jgi:Endonuclease/Exonuclease/phosphatase family